MKIEMVPVAVLFTFDTAHKKRTDKTKFYRKFYGFTDRSQFGRYTYDKLGVLSPIRYLKPTRSTIIVKREDAFTIREFFKKERVRFSENLVILHPKQARILQITHPSIWQNVIEDLKGSSNLLVTVDF